MFEMEDSLEKRWERIEKLMNNLEPTPELIDSIIAMNDGLYERFKMAFNDLLKMKGFIDEEIDSGRLQVSGYEIFPEYSFASNKLGGIPTADSLMMLDLSRGVTEYLMPSLSLDEKKLKVDLDYETAFLESDLFMNWNIEFFDLPGLENHQIHYFMHTMFQDSRTFCPADIPYLNPDDLEWWITVQYKLPNK